MHRALLLLTTPLFVLAACHPLEVAPDAAEDALTLRPNVTVDGGFGSGRYRIGSRVHVFADLDPFTQRITGWTGYPSQEWHLDFAMPSRSLTLTPQIEDHPLEVLPESFTGVTGRPKRVNLAIAPNARGVLFVLHGTGGSANFADNIEGRALMIEAHARGLTIIVPEAEEVVAGDLDGNGKIRWDSSLTADNVDFANLDRLLSQLEAAGRIPANGPRYSVGMSNGGAMSIGLGAITGNSALARRWPELSFAGVTSYCASGEYSSAQVTVTRTAWRMCGNDLNENVGQQGNEEAARNSRVLALRGVPTEITVRPASPLYDQRFERVGLLPETAAAIAAELRAGGFVDAEGYFTANIEEIIGVVSAEPAEFPTLTGLDPKDASGVKQQIMVMYADHAMYADANDRTLDFLGIR